MDCCEKEEEEARAMLLSSFYQDPAIQRLREAEKELWKYFGLQDVMNEQFLALGPNNNNNPALLGVRTARVFTLALPNKEEGIPEEIPILLVHGGGGTAGDWANLLPLLLKPGRTIYVVERPGNGLSEPVDYSNCHLGEFSVAFLEQVISALQLTKVHLVGNSLGGGTVLFYSFAQARNNNNNTNKVASVSALGVPAGFQGMLFPPKIVCWLVNFASIVASLASLLLPYLPWAPVLVLVLALGVPYRALPKVYVHYAWRSHCIYHNVASFMSILWALWEASRNGKGWKLTDLKQLSQSIPVLITEGRGEILLTRSHRAEFARQLGPHRYITDLGDGHAPWVSDPIGYSRVLEQFWQEAEEQEGTNDYDCSSSWEPIPWAPADSMGLLSPCRSVSEVVDVEELDNDDDDQVGNLLPPKMD